MRIPAELFAEQSFVGRDRAKQAGRNGPKRERRSAAKKIVRRAVRSAVLRRQ